MSGKRYPDEFWGRLGRNPGKNSGNAWACRGIGFRKIKRLMPLCSRVPPYYLGSSPISHPIKTKG
jgi:hypothetical protein